MPNNCSNDQVNNQCVESIGCAIDLLNTLKNNINLDLVNGETVSLDTVEAATRLFDYLVKAKDSLVVSDNTGQNICDLSSLTTAPVVSYGFAVYLQSICKYVQRDFLKIVLSAQKYQYDGVAWVPTPGLINFYLSDLVNNTPPIFYGKDPGVDNGPATTPPPMPLIGDCYIVIDKNELLNGICELENHYIARCPTNLITKTDDCECLFDQPIVGATRRFDNGNQVAAINSTVSGGQGNTIFGSGTNGVIPGGFSNTVSGLLGFAAGRMAVASNTRSAVFGLQDMVPTSSKADSTFTIGFDGSGNNRGLYLVNNPVIVTPTPTHLLAIDPSVAGCGHVETVAITDLMLSLFDDPNLNGATRRINITNLANAMGSTVSGGTNNTSGGLYSVVAGGQSNTGIGNFSSVSGGINNKSVGNNSAVINGTSNISIGINSVVSGGQNNTSTGSNSVVSGGFSNTVYGSESSISSGVGNYIIGGSSIISAGLRNTITNNFSSISGGYNNRATGSSSSISGGQYNRTSGRSSMISGGEFNSSSGARSTVSGGFANTSSGSNSVVSGGSNNRTTRDNTAVIGGFSNTNSGGGSVISGGFSNSISGIYSAISGGRSNTSIGFYSAISGGRSNRSVGQSSAISGGDANTSSGQASVVSGGLSNISSGIGAAISGGNRNTTSGVYSAIAGGRSNTVSGIYSFSTGFQSVIAATHSNSAVFGLQNATTTSSVAANTFTIGFESTNASRGLYLINNPTGTGLALQINGNQVVTNTSSRRFKTEIETLPTTVVDKLNMLRPVQYQRIDASGQLEFGLIAEETIDILPEIVVNDSSGEPYGIKYQNLISILISKTQRQDTLIETLTSETNTLKSQRQQRDTVIESLQSEINLLKSQVQTIETWRQSIG